MLNSGDSGKQCDCDFNCLHLSARHKPQRNKQNPPSSTLVSSFQQVVINISCKQRLRKKEYTYDLGQNLGILRSKPASLSCIPGSPERNQNVRCSQCWAGRRTGVHTLSLQLPAYTSGSEGFVCKKILLDIVYICPGGDCNGIAIFFLTKCHL